MWWQFGPATWYRPFAELQPICGKASRTGVPCELEIERQRWPVTRILGTFAVHGELAAGLPRQGAGWLCETARGVWVALHRDGVWLGGPASFVPPPAVVADGPGEE
jgi:hypothetical protein